MTLERFRQAAEIGRQGLEELRRAFSRDTHGDFSHDVRGTIAVMFALLAVPLLGVIFFAFDYSKATSVKSSVQSAADAAAFTASMQLGGDNDDVRAAFESSFRANLPEGLKEQPFTLIVAKDKKSFDVSMTARVKTTVVKIAGIPEIKFEMHAFARKPTVNLSPLARGGNGPGGDAAVKAEVISQLQKGLAAARASGLAVPANLDAGQLERMADMILQQMGKSR